METVNSLINKGLNKDTAISLIDIYKNKLNTRNGIYIISDITYMPEIHGKDIELTCAECGSVIHRVMIKGRNKWSELIKNCPCQKISDLKNMSFAEAVITPKVINGRPKKAVSA